MSTNYNAEENPVLPESEVNSVVLYLQSNSADINAEDNAVKDDLHPVVNEKSNPSSDVESHPIVDGSNSVVANLETNLVVLDVESHPTPLDLELAKSELEESTKNQHIQVQLKSEEGRLLLILPTESQVPASEYNWSDLWQQMKLRLLASDRFFSDNTHVQLVAQDRLLDGRQLQELAETLNQFQIHLKSVSTSRRQTAIVAATAGYSVEQIQAKKTLRSESKPARPPLVEPLYLEKTVRSGEEIRHPGHIILLGDLNPGGIVVADGDILVWGRLRGVSHAGASGNHECLIMALHMEPTQLRIADAMARAPETAPTQFQPEVAYVTSQGIRIGRATDVSRILLNRLNNKHERD